VADEKPPPEFVSALGTEYFVLQSTVRDVRYGRWSFLFTMASMVIVVNCVVGGATVALLCDLVFKAPLPAAAVT